MAAIARSPYLQKGCGNVPATSLIAAAWKELLEMPSTTSLGVIAEHLGTQLDFTKEGLTLSQFRAFFQEAIKAAKKGEPIVESGNKYGVSSSFAKMNGELLLEEIKCSATYQALSDKDKLRADEFFSLMCFNGDLRSRNPLHPTPLDSAVLGNLVNFPKHIFGFPFGGYSTNGHEALSLCLYSYRQECISSSPVVVYVLADVEEEPADAKAICLRLGMEFLTVKDPARGVDVAMERVAVVMTKFSNRSLPKTAKWAQHARLSMHVCVLDQEFRDVFASNPEPVHFDLPSSIRSMSLHDGMFNTGFQLYRDAHLRDLHFDLPYAWPTAYMSPNEGGSGNSTPFFIDFCFMLLGWSALRDIAMNRVSESDSGLLRPISCGPSEADVGTLQVPQGAESFDEILDWGKVAMHLPREDLERHFVEFQRNFLGGKSRDLEAIVTSGGTRSLALSFESVILNTRKVLGLHAPIKVITGNPHLAIERSERRFQFQVVRVERDGAVCVEWLQREITDPSVVIVCAQTLSYTDGITDPLPEILEVIEEENRRRRCIGGLPVTLINDCCLAFSVLVHNNGQNGSPNLRMLDVSEKYITPVIVTLDAHKHLGADKGISTAIGTAGTLANLSGYAKVGATASKGELIRAIADMSLIGTEGYHEKYHGLATAVQNTVRTMETSGMRIIHANNRVKGSTVFAVEDPSAVMIKQLKKKGHGTAAIFAVAPNDPSRCQTGFQLSLTPHALRQMKGGESALDIFTRDVVEVHKASQAKYPVLAKSFRESSLLAILLAGGNEDLWAFELLRRPGLGRKVVSLILRRLYSAILDSGVTRSNKHPAPLKAISRNMVFLAVLQVLVLFMLRLRRRLARHLRV